MKMDDIENWKDRANIVEFLSERLTCGHVMPFLGSGISYFAELPAWDALIASITAEKDPKYKLPTEGDPYTRVEKILFGPFNGDRQALYRAVHRRLYEGKTAAGLSSLIQSDKGMRALTMLCHRSVRGGSRFIFTLNYDNILEMQLRELSLVVQSVGDHRFLFGDHDVSVLHPHGLLAIEDCETEMERRIVISQGDSSAPWRSLIEVFVSKAFPIFIGIGGSDWRFLDYLDGAFASNYVHEVKSLPFVGVRLCAADDDSIELFEGKKIKCVAFGNLKDEWPKFVEDICKRSARKVQNRMDRF